MRITTRVLAGFLILSLVLAVILANPKLPGIISDGMVLQQGVKVPIWGWADPHERITVEFGGQKVTEDADGEGKWKLFLSPLEVSDSGQMTVRGNKSIVVHNVLVGEVWLCSGQSNMEFPLGSTTTADVDVPNADYPQIRLFTVPRSCVLDPSSDTEGNWVECSPENAADFSAVAYHFGSKLHKEQSVPVGLIESSWGGTQAEEWTRLEALEEVEIFEPILQRWDETAPEVKNLLRAPARFALNLDDVELLPTDTGSESMVLADFENGKLQTRIGGVWSEDLVDPRGAYSLKVESPGRAGSRGAASIHGRMEISHWPMIRMELAPEGSPVDLSRYRGIRFYSRGEGLFRIHFLQPSVTDWDHYASPIYEASDEWIKSVVLFEELKQAGWGKAQPFTPAKLTGMILEPRLTRERLSRPPSGLFNGMIFPLAPFAIRGAIWYQGEGNAGRAYQYRQLLPTMIKSWRSLWGQPEFPFLIVQLPNFKPRKAEPSESAWAELREAQLMTLSLPQTGLAVSIDVGEADDVHPRNKTEIGNRLAAWALGTVYGKKVVYSGPLVEDVRFEGNKAILSFVHTGGGLVARGSQGPQGFTLAGPDQKFFWARARIIGSEVEVWSDLVSNPVSVRYGWADNPNCTLYNKEGFPASPFRTDDWPGVTVDSK